MARRVAWPGRPATITAPMASLPTERRGFEPMTSRISLDRYRPLRLAGTLIGLAVALGACTHTDGVPTTAAIPNDYHMRHPIAVEEANHSIVVFVGRGRGGLSAPQRTDVAGLGQSWVQEATGAIVADVPVNTPNARAAADSLREIRSVLLASGVPARGLIVHNYHPDD